MNQSSKRTGPVSAGESDFEAEVLRCQQPVMVVFSAPWSQPCQLAEAVLEELAGLCAGKVKIVKVEADDNPDLSLWYEVQSIPTLLYFVDGNVQARIVGTASKEAIISKFQLPCSEALGARKLPPRTIEPKT